MESSQCNASSTSPTPRRSGSQPDPDALESFDDLIREQHHTPHRNSVHSSGLVAEDDDELGESTSSSVTVRASPDPPITQSPRVSQRHTRDESRWNGWHLWRLESYNRRMDEQRQATEVRSPTQPALIAHKAWTKLLSVLSSAGRGVTEWSMPALQAVLLTVVMAGAQLAWTLGFGYGTPYLVSLGLSESTMSLVWLAAPVSGLVIQLLVGVWTDRSVSLYKRRRYIFGSTILLALSVLLLDLSKPLASMLADVLHAGLADWDPVRKDACDAIHVLLATSAFLCMVVSINGTFAAARSLVLDVTPSMSHARAAAWSARMAHAGALLGYTAVWYDMHSSKWFAWLGGDAFHKYTLVILIGVSVCSGITCFTVREHLEIELPDTSSGLQEVQASCSAVPEHPSAVTHLWQSLRRLPRPVRRICLVQFVAQIAWFPFLFYVSEWILQVWQQAHGKHGKTIHDDALQEAKLALLVFSGSALVAGILLPYISLASVPDRGIFLHTEHDPVQRSMTTHRLTLRTIWMLSLCLYGVTLCLGTFLVHSTTSAIVLVSLVGLSWAAIMWVPFTLVMDSVREAEDGLSPYEFEADWFAPERVRRRRENGSGFTNLPETSIRGDVENALSNCGPLRRNTPNRRVVSDQLPSRNATSQTKSAAQKRVASSILTRGGSVIGSTDQNLSSSSSSMSNPDGATETPGTLPGIPMHAYPAYQGVGGTVLAIHNASIVLPQLAVATIVFFFLRHALPHSPRPVPSDGVGSAILALFPARPVEQDGIRVVWILRAAGVAALFAAALCRFVPYTRTERVLRGEQTRDVPILPPRYDDEASDDDSADDHTQP